jgi:hypothetical protein
MSHYFWREWTRGRYPNTQTERTASREGKRATFSTGMLGFERVLAQPRGAVTVWRSGSDRDGSAPIQPISRGHCITVDMG